VGLLSEVHLDQYGPITRTVKDAALMLDVIKGPFEGDKNSLPAENISYLENIDNPPKDLKIGYSLKMGFIKAIESEVEENFLNKIQKFEEFGWPVESVKFKFKRPDYVINVLFSSFLAYDMRSYLDEYRDKLDPEFLRVVEAGLTYTGQDIMRSLDIRKKMYEVMYRYFKEYDILLTPTNATTAFKAGPMFPEKINGKPTPPTGFMANGYPFNITGHPAASIPSGWSSEGLPFGLQIVGKRFSDLLVLQVAKAFEDLCPWQDKHPSFD
jgi:Asp-tRNA(Asn)/Glu-tRNA(Gln) amidotransferase A subunit family amidase